MAISSLINKLSMAAVTTAVVAIGTVNSAQAAAITFSGTLTDGETQTDFVQPGNNINNPSGWDFWRFFGNTGDVATVTVRRLVGSLDPALGVWFGTETDTSNYTSLFSNSANTPLVDSADDELPPAVPGRFGDPSTTFTLANTGFYTVGVSSFASDFSTEPLAYQISLTGSGVPVPEPGSVMGIVVLGTLGAGSMLKRKQQQKV
jgi:hypothetical protein